MPTNSLDSEMSEKKRSTFGLRLSQLADLFAIAVKNQALTEFNCTDEHFDKKLHKQLIEVIAGNSFLFPAASEIAENEQDVMTSLTGQSLREILFNPQSSVEQLHVVKEAGKRLTTTCTSEVERAIVTTIYHAAIACSLVYHNKKISQHSYDKLDESFTLLIEKKWMTHELVQLFSQARHVCQNKRNKK